MNFILLMFTYLSIQNSDSLAEEQRLKIKVENISTAPVIDGKLNDECWNEASVCSSFVQTAPFCGKASTSKTIVKVIRDSKTLFVSFYCPKQNRKPVAGVVKEDVLGMNDQVMIILDTYNDKNKAYLFAVNPLNVKTEAKISKDGRVIDTQWDEIWYSGVSVSDTGWTAEFAIPFNNLHFNTESGYKWGANFVRVDYEDLPESEWSVWSYTGANPYRVSKTGEFIFKEKPVPSSPLTIMPYGAIRGEKKNIGGDIKRTFLTLMDLGFSLYTDPNYYDVNQNKVLITPTKEQVLTIPEERNILVENRTFLFSPYPLINTRAMDSIKYAYRISGKAREYDAAYLNVNTMKPEQNYSFLCIEREFFRGSSVSWYDLKVDTNRVMSTQLDFSLPREIRPEFQYSWNLGEKAPSLFYCNVSKETPLFSVGTGYVNVNPKFRANMGMFPDSGQDYWVMGNYNLRMNKIIYKITPSFSYNKDTSSAGICLLLKNGIEGGVWGWQENDNHSSLYDNKTYFIGYNKNNWAPMVRVSYLPWPEKVCLAGRLSFFGKVAPDFEVSALHLNGDSVSVDLGLSGRAGEKVSFRIFSEKGKETDLVSTNGVLRYRFKPEGYFSVAYGETRNINREDLTRKDYVLEAKIYYQFGVAVEKLSKLAF
ncbi:MAG: carbohydrate binding family 9 domain-containing protein [bacterium]|nr:carbohydrate binding family 9 domain-containing protein [bacterium]